MPHKGKKSPLSFTLIIVPHSNKSSFALRVPFWAVYVAVGLLIVGAARLALFVADYNQATAQLAQLRRGGQVEIVRERQLRTTIGAQQAQLEDLRGNLVAQQSQSIEDVIRFEDEVAQLKSQIADLEQFKADIRRIVGISAPPTPEPEAKAPAAQPAPPAPQAKAAAPAATSAAPAPQAQPAPSAVAPSTATAAPVAAAPAAPATPAVAAAPAPPAIDRAAAALSSRGAAPVAAVTQPAAGAKPADALQAAAELQNTLPQQIADLASLKEAVNDRAAKVEGKFQDANQLSTQLQIYDAAPRAWPIRGAITDRFGYDARRLYVGAQADHKGIDIAASYGAPIRAPADGVVTSFGWEGSYGLTMRVRHSMGWSTIYGHMSGAAVKVGEQVKTGQVLGYVGLTGLTTGAHLHFEVYYYGTTVDPLTYLGR